MSLTNQEEKELKTLQAFIELREITIHMTRKYLKNLNNDFNKAKKRAKELMNKQ